MTTFYVDTSHHDRERRNAPLDWTAIGASMGQAEVMIARATYGDPSGWRRVTRYFGEMQEGARAAGYSWRGGYHNLIRGDAASIARQVDWLRAELDRYGCTWAMCDIEAYQELRDAGLVPRWVDIMAWHDRWYAVDDRICSWYLPRWFYNGYLGGTPDLRELTGPLIQSNYPGGDGTAQQIYTANGGDSGTGWDDLYGNRLPDIWQFTSSANVTGATGSTDTNAYRGTVAALVKLLGGDVSYDEVWRTDKMRNPYGDAATNPTIQAETGMYNVMTHTWQTNSTVAALRIAVAKLQADVDELQAKPPVVAGPVDPAALKAALLDPEVLAAFREAARQGAELAEDS